MSSNTWIEVREQKPEDGEIVVVISRADIRVVLYDRGQWFDEIFGGFITGVTHWMPLPPAPKVE